MDLIEKAAAKLGGRRSPSLVERAAERMGPADEASAPVQDNAPDAVTPATAKAPAATPPKADVVTNEVTAPVVAPEPASPPAKPARTGKAGGKTGGKAAVTDPPKALSPAAEARQPETRSDKALTPAGSSLPADEQKRVTIDLDALHAAGMVTPRGERSRFAEEYRVIKRPLMLRAFAGRTNGASDTRHANLIMVSSAVPGEGKTFTAVNLAMSMAKERDTYVLLVDADLSRPSLAGMFGLESALGLSDLLEDENLDVGEVLLRTDVPNLSMIPAGRPHAMGTELLASDRAGRVINEIANRYPNRVIIFDSAPVLASSEGGALSKYVGQVVFVVEAENTPEAAVKGAIEVLSGCKHVGLVLNKARSSLAGSRLGGYYGSYYYQYGEG